MKSLLKCHPLRAVDFIRGEGAWLYDIEGRAYLDLESGSWAAVLGHSHPEIVSVLREEAGRLMHLGVRTPNHLAQQAAEAVLELVDLIGGKCTFLSSGSEAVEFAVQAAKRLRPRPLCLCLQNSYLSAYGTSAWKKPEEWLQVDPSPCSQAELEARLSAIPFDQVSSVVLETGGGGSSFVRFPDKALVESMVRKAQKQGVLLISNEVTCGFGRTGTWFGYQHYAIQPDIVAVGKGLGNGYPVSAVALRAGLGEELEQASFYHAQSHQNNPLGCAVALAVIRTLRTGDWIKRGESLGQRFMHRLREMAAHKSSIKDLRGRGLLLMVELHREASLDGASLQQALWNQGLIVGAYAANYPAGTGIRLDPPLVLEESEMELCLEKLDELLS